MRSTIIRFAALGQFPTEDAATAPQVRELQQALRAIEPPFTKEEALVLLAGFGHDGCFGLAWSLIHLIEADPRWPYPEAELRAANPWVRRLLERAR